MSDVLVHLEVRDGRAVVTLDAPRSRNALSSALLGQLLDALRSATADPRARVVVLTGAGPVFCSGADLKEQRAGGPPLAHGLPEVLLLLAESPVPVVARVNGPARAGGLGLLAACDLAVGLESATFGFSEVRIGVAPAIISVPCLRRMDPRAARELFLTGEPFDGRRALEAGLLDRAVPDGALDATVDELVRQLLLAAPGALAAAKRLLREVPGTSLAEDYRRMAELSAALFASEEGREGIAALLDKRPPSWVAAAQD